MSNSRIDELLRTAKAMEADKRAGFLDTACGADTDLRNAVEDRLQDAAGPIENAKTRITSAVTISDAPPKIQNYRIRSVLGQGGMGIVYRAEQVQLQRIVALKMLATPGPPTKEQLDRFHAEASALARLRHPNIVEIFDYGEWNGRPYFVMEMVEGRSLAELAAGSPQVPRFAAQIMMVVARAVQAFHQKGILHRDLKPANVLLQDLSTDDPDRSIDPATSVTFNSKVYVPKITDFGVAKDLLADQKFTRTGTAVGTPQYMAPEQAESEYMAIGPATDVYGLGASLYELLTGLPPIRGATPLETLAQIATHEPVAPSMLQPGVPRDLDVICGKCLEKLPTRRYATAQALAEDLQSFLEGKPIKARPAGAVVKMVRWCRRRPTVAAFAGMSVLLALVLILSMVAYNARLGTALGEARNNAEESRERLVKLYTISGMSDVEEGMLFSGLLWFSQGLLEDHGHPEAERRHRTRIATTRNQVPELVYLWGGTERISAVAVSRSGRWAALADESGRVRIWDVETGESGGAEIRFDKKLVALTLSEEGDWIAGIDEAGKARLWNRKVGASTQTSFDQETFDQVGFLAKHKRLFLRRSDTVMKLWNIESKTWAPIPGWPTSASEIIASATDGKCAVVIARESLANVARIWELGDEVIKQARVFPIEGQVERVAVSHEARRLAVIGKREDPSKREAYERIWLMDTDSGKLVRGVLPHPREVTAAVFSVNGEILLTACADHRGRVWDAKTGDLRTVETIHRADGVAVTFSQDGKLLATGGYDNQARVWNLETGEPRSPPLQHQGTLRFVGFGNGASNTLLTADETSLRVWRLKKPIVIDDRFRAPTAAPTTKHTTSPDGRYQLHVKNETAQVIDASTKEPVGRPLAHASRILYGAFGPDSKLIVTTSEDNTARIWDVATGQLIATPMVHNGDVFYAAFSPDGKSIVTTSNDRTARLWDVSTGEPLSPPWRHRDNVVFARFEPDGKTVKTTDANGLIYSWDITPDDRPADEISLWSQVVSGSSFAKNKGIVPFEPAGLFEAWNRLQEIIRNEQK